MPLNEPSLAEDKVDIGLFVMLMAAPPVTDIPLTIDVPVTEVPVIPVIPLVLIVMVVPVEELMADTPFPALDKVPIVLLEIAFVGEAEELAIPVTAPAVDDKPVMVFKLVLFVKVVAG